MKNFYEEYLKKVKNSFDPFVVENNKTLISNWPKEWTEVEYKEYKRFQNIPLKLSSGELNQKSLLEALNSRDSNKIIQNKQLTFEVLSEILYYSVGEKEHSKKRFYPSAGARYPLEFYLILNQDLAEVRKGVYHFNIKNKSLEFMWPNPLAGVDIFAFYREKNMASAYIVATSLIERSARKYGELSLKFSYLETGTAFQNILLLASVLSISNSICNHDDVKLEKILDIDGEREFVTGAIALDFPNIIF